MHEVFLSLTYSCFCLKVLARTICMLMCNVVTVLSTLSCGNQSNLSVFQSVYYGSCLCENPICDMFVFFFPNI